MSIVFLSCMKLEVSEKESMIKDLQTEKELKEDKGNIKELQKEADKLNIK
jgi:hypothetical protein